MIALMDAGRSTRIVGSSPTTKGMVEGRGLVFCSSGLPFTRLLLLGFQHGLRTIGSPGTSQGFGVGLGELRYPVLWTK